MDELRRRALASTAEEVTVLASGGDLLRRAGVLAGVVPAAPQRSIFNGVHYREPAGLLAALDELEAAYAAAGVAAWTVWVPDADRRTAESLSARGHALDGAPRAMSLWLVDLEPGPPPVEGVSPASGTLADAGRINDRAYGIEGPGFSAGLSGSRTARGAEWSFAAAGGELVACLATVPAADDDVLVSCVATLPEWRGRGIAGWLLRRALAARRERGARSASLRASAMGAGVYERLGFRDHGFVELWEKRSG